MKTSFTAAALAAAALLGGPLRAHAQDKPFTALSRTLLAGRDSLVHLAREQVGLRYRWGAVRPGLAFDCSGLVKWLLSAFDLAVPRTAAQQARVGVSVPRDTAQLLPGDLLFFGHGRRVSHIGIYVGEGKYVHAANRRKGVIESDITQVSTAWWKGVRRVILEPDSSMTGIRVQDAEVRGPSPHL
jgi:cell wall-associated NlpC family hydrolase